MEKTQLSKLALPTVGEPEDLLCCGTMDFYDKTYDRVNVKSERPLKRIDRVFHTVTTTDDPIIRYIHGYHAKGLDYGRGIRYTQLGIAVYSVTCSNFQEIDKNPK